MKIHMVVLGALVVACAPASTSTKLEPLIIGGNDASQGEFPYQIFLRGEGRLFCGGSLVVVNNQQVVLSAAHCVAETNASEITVVGGALNRLDISGFEQDRQVAQIISHEEYGVLDDGTVDNDVAVLLMDSPFDVNENVAPINLPQKQQQTLGQVVISGWGVTNENSSSHSDILQKVQVPVVDDMSCQQAYSKLNLTILPNMLCTGLLHEGGKDACVGDSGGPVRAVEGNYLAGIISWGEGCGDPSYPGVNMEVSYFIDWLEAVVPRTHY